MKEIFLKFLNSSISASWLVLVILLLRILLKRSPRKLTCALWALVAIRLICPIQMESPLSLIPSSEPIGQEVFSQLPTAIFEDAPGTDSNLEEINTSPLQGLVFDIPDTPDSENSTDLLSMLSIVWAVGITGMAAYAVIGSIRMQKHLSASICIRPGIYSCDYIDSPFIFGITKPKIYFPSCLTAEELPYVLAHEKAHIQRRDHIWKPLGFLILSVHWFNPVMWIAYKAFCRDMEFASDEQVIKNLDTSGKAAYSRTLLRYSGPGALAVGPLAFGEKDVAHRINHVLHYRRPAAWITGIGVLTGVVLAVCFLTNPVHPKSVSAEAPDSQTINLLIVGQNIDTDSETRVVDSNTVSKLKPADSIVLASVNPGSKTMTLTSFAQNTFLDIPVIQDYKGNFHEGRSTLSLCYPLGVVWGGTLGGLDLLGQCITENFGVPIDGSIQFSYDAFVLTVDALGGIDVELNQNEADYLADHGFSSEALSTGKNRLGGNALLCYSYIPDEDVTVQIGRQQIVAQGILEKCQRLSNDQLNQLLDALLPIIITDMEYTAIEEIRESILPLIRSMRFDFRQCPADGTAEVKTIDSHTVFYPDLEQNRKLLADIAKHE